MNITENTNDLFAIIDLPLPDCITVDVGTSGSESKNVSLLSSSYKCPSKVNKTNWLGVERHNDLFEVMQIGATVTVTRINGMAWGLDLKFNCCSK